MKFRIVMTALLGFLCAPSIQADVAAEGIEQADRVVVVKSERKLYLMKEGLELRSMDVSLGLAPSGHKRQSGDSRTPEGVYYLDLRNPDSDFFLSLHVSYPNANDRALAARAGLDPGGQIMIHGMPNDLKYDEAKYEGWDWTDGCIAVSNADMIDIWLMTPTMTPIEIRP